MGGWWVQFLRDNDCSVVFTSKDEHTELEDNSVLVSTCDVIILAVPIAFMEEVLEEIFLDLKGKILIDVCSVKQFLIEKYQTLKKEQTVEGLQFLSVHPMFSQSITSLDGQVFTMTFRDNLSKTFENDFRKLLEAHHAVVHDIDFIAHDKLMGVIQGLNHFNLFVSAKTLSRFAPQS